MNFFFKNFQQSLSLIKKIYFFIFWITLACPIFWFTYSNFILAQGHPPRTPWCYPIQTKKKTVFCGWFDKKKKIIFFGYIRKMIFLNDSTWKNLIFKVKMICLDNSFFGFWSTLMTFVNDSFTKKWRFHVTAVVESSSTDCNILLYRDNFIWSSECRKFYKKKMPKVWDRKIRPNEKNMNRQLF